MPIYEFRCQKCGQRFEKLCTMGEQGDNLQCPACGAGSPRRLMSGFARSSGGQTSASSSGGCSTCSAGSCAGCH